MCDAQNVTTSGFHIPVPHITSEVMIDGVLSKGEWQTAKLINVPGVANLYFQESAEFLYIAIEYTSAPSGMVDLYLSPEKGEIHDFHASAKLGERTLRENSDSGWVWWNNNGWIANVSRVDLFEQRTFMPTRVREYQIRRTRFPSSTWRVRFELTTMSTKNETQPVTVFPQNTTGRSTAGWLELNLAGSKDHSK